MNVLKRILAFFYPPRCILCGRTARVNDDGLCAVCAEKPAERVCRFFALHVRRRDYTLACFAPMRYREPFRTTLWHFKFRNETSLAGPLAKRMALVRDPDRAYDCVVPVPISRERLRERGYNQSALLARSLSAQIRVPYRELLEKTRHNRTQHRLSAKERAENVRGTYRAEGAAGLRILLVDDIVTTGATMCECARTLYRAGAQDVACICCAVVPEGQVSTQ
ncbi:MAG: ComF family protein [Hominenteromicrobium sp.]